MVEDEEEEALAFSFTIALVAFSLTRRIAARPLLTVGADLIDAGKELEVVDLLGAAARPEQAWSF